MTTLRLVDKYRNNGGEWFCEPENSARVAYILKELAAFREAEPGHDWQLETRGSMSGWHRFDFDAFACPHPSTKTSDGAVICSVCNQTLLP